MSIKKITSLTALLSFLLTLLTSIVLYIAPQGRVAYWVDWKLLGISKDAWSDLHLNLGVLFLLSLGVHIYYNWKPLVSYLKDKVRKLRVLTPEFNAALILTVAFSVLSLLNLPPVQWLVDGSAYFKARAERVHGAPPYGRAELSSLQGFAQKTGADLELGIKRLQESGIRVTDANATIQKIAADAGVSPQKVYDILRATGTDSSGLGPSTIGPLPETPPPGLGRKTIAEFCAQYRLDPTMVLGILRNQHINADADMQLKTVAEAHQAVPSDLYTLIRRKLEKSD